VNSEVLAEVTGRAGAVIMGRKMFYPTSGDWQETPRGQWGDDPPFHAPVYVLTHHNHRPVEMEGGTTFYFVTDGIESALARARDAAGDKDVQIAGGASVLQQCIRAGLLDEIQIHISPLFLGAGSPLFANLAEAPRKPIPDRAIHSENVTHVRYRFDL
jgi:dihydrofolate reductase